MRARSILLPLEHGLDHVVGDEGRDAVIDATPGEERKARFESLYQAPDLHLRRPSRMGKSGIVNACLSSEKYIKTATCDPPPCLRSTLRGPCPVIWLPLGGFPRAFQAKKYPFA